MKLSTAFYLLSTAATAQACVTAHSWFRSCTCEIADGINHIVVQLWDNSVEVCKVGVEDPDMSDDSVYNRDCGNGASVTIYGPRGQKIDYHSATDNYFVSLDANDYHFTATGCCQTDDITIHGSEAESVFADQYCGNCNTAKLCDYRDFCPGFDASCH